MSTTTINPHAIGMSNGVVFQYGESDEYRMGDVEVSKPNTITIRDLSRDGDYRQFSRKRIRNCQLWQRS
jgi:hypothetical protein